MKGPPTLCTVLCVVCLAFPGTEKNRNSKHRPDFSFCTSLNDACLCGGGFHGHLAFQCCVPCANSWDETNGEDLNVELQSRTTRQNRLAEPPGRTILQNDRTILQMPEAHRRKRIDYLLFNVFVGALILPGPSQFRPPSSSLVAQSCRSTSQLL